MNQTSSAPRRVTSLSKHSVSAVLFCYFLFVFFFLKQISSIQNVSYKEKTCGFLSKNHLAFVNSNVYDFISSLLIDSLAGFKEQREVRRRKVQYQQLETKDCESVTPKKWGTRDKETLQSTVRDSSDTDFASSPVPGWQMLL